MHFNVHTKSPAKIVFNIFDRLFCWRNMWFYAIRLTETLPEFAYSFKKPLLFINAYFAGESRKVPSHIALYFSFIFNSCLQLQQICLLRFYCATRVLSPVRLWLLLVNDSMHELQYKAVIGTLFLACYLRPVVGVKAIY